MKIFISAMMDNRKKLQTLLDAASKLRKVSSIAKHDLYPLLVETTSFLDSGAAIATRIWHVVHGAATIPKCSVCSNYVTWRKEKAAYNLFCSSKCGRNHQSTKDKISSTNIEKYGSASCLSNVDVRKKMKKTIKSRYGVNNISQLDLTKQKKEHTSMSNYGVTHYRKTQEGKDQVRKTKLEKYGCTNNLTSPDQKKANRETNNAKYGYNHFQQQHYATGVMEKLMCPDWLNAQHITHKKTLTDIAHELGINDTTVGKYLRMHNIPTHRYFRSSAEIQLCTLLGEYTTVNSNTRSVIPPLEIDLFLPDHKLAIEYCGLYWHSEQAGKDRNYHRNKFTLCRQQGIQLLTIFSDEWENHAKIVWNTILYKIGKATAPKINARNCKIEKCSTGEFLIQWHLQGDGGASSRYNLLCEGVVVAQIAISDKTDIEITRYATNCTVRGGFGKLLAHLQSQYPNRDIVTYSDNRWSDGSLYKQAGFTIDYELQPDYYYSPDGHTRYHKFNYRHKYLSTRLKNYDPNLSEWENCKANDVLKIWDCGKIKWRLKTFQHV